MDEDGAEVWAEPDDPPELTEAMLAQAEVWRGGVLVRRGLGDGDGGERG